MNSKTRLTLVMFILGPCAALLGQGFDEFPFRTDSEPRFPWSTTGFPASASPGEVVSATFSVHVPADHYLYQDQIDFSLSGKDLPIEIGDLTLPEAEEHIDPILDEPMFAYDESTSFVVPLQVAGDAVEGTYEFTLTVSCTGCDRELCYPPESQEFDFSIRIDGPPIEAPAATPSESETDGVSLEDRLQKSLRGNILFALPLAFLLGALTSLTPCVYPLIPITISIFGASDAGSRSRRFLLSLTYVLGIVVTYSVLGGVVIAFGGTFGAIAGNRWAVGALAAFLVALGASMLGAFNLSAPAGVQGKLMKISGKGFARAFGMGLALGIVAAPCTGPALALILAFAAEAGNAFQGMLAMVAYALGLGMLFLVIGTFAGSLHALPRSGPWMNKIKSIFAVALFTTALYFLGAVFSGIREFFETFAGSSLVVAVLVALSFMLGAFEGGFEGLKRSRVVARILGLSFATAAVYMLILAPGIIERREREFQLPWIDDHIEGFRIAKETGRPIMMRFTADWCVSCKKLDHGTFPNRSVHEALDRFVLIQVDMSPSEKTPEKEALEEKYGVIGYSTILFLDPEGNPIPGKRIIGHIGPEDFVKVVEGIELSGS